MNLRTIAIFLSLLVSSCGYHLAGQGRGSIPEDVNELALIAVGDAAQEILPVMRNQLLSNSLDIAPVVAGESDAEFRLDDVSEDFSPVSFDASGVAVTYRLSLSGRVSLWRGGNIIWESSSIHKQGDVYVVGDPASTEALKKRLKKDLQKQWVREAWRALTSGF